MDKMKAVLMIGPPGAGKGTQARLLSDTKRFFHLSTGDELRKLDESTELGAKVKALIDEGNYVPDDMMLKLFDELMGRYIALGTYDPIHQYALLDGIPRTVEQAVILDEVYDVRRVLYFEADNWTLIQRIERRGKEEGRKDDTDVGIIANRLIKYREKTLPLLAHYPSDLVVNIDGTGNEEEVHQLVLGSLSDIYRTD